MLVVCCIPYPGGGDHCVPRGVLTWWLGFLVKHKSKYHWILFMFGGDSILRIVLVVAAKDILDFVCELLLLSAATM